MSELVIKGEIVTDEELERAVDIVREYAETVKEREPKATVSIDHLMYAAQNLPRSVEEWLDEYPAR